MSHLPENRMLIPSVLDRLVQPTEKSRAALQRDIKLAVRRDLENLLNTRWRCKLYPPNYAVLEASLVNYGIPDLTRIVARTEEDYNVFLNDIREAIVRFEPRLAKVAVERVNNPDPYDRTLRFQIIGILEVRPYSEDVSYETSIDPSTSTFKIKNK